MLNAKVIIFLSVFVLVFFFAFKVNGNQDGEICLKKSYELYKKNFVSNDGRVIDYDRNNVTTSEGQSYMLLRSLIMNDRVNFGLVYKWTKDNLQRQDKLFSWLWGKDKNGQYTTLDENSASDADIDIAFALLLAYEKWGEYQYLEEAKPIIISIWYNETKTIGDYLTLMPGVKQTKDEKIKINPSYFSPYAFKMFQKYDELHDWDLLVQSSYFYLNESCKKTQSHLPPNWFLIENGEIVLEDSANSDFSYDAVRVFPRVYLDYINTRDKRALAILQKSQFFVEQWKNSKTFYTNYRADGQLRDKYKFVGARAIITPAISIINKRTANTMYQSQIKPSFEDENYWADKTDYYGKNLSWFGDFANNNSPSTSLVHECPLPKENKKGANE